MMKDTWGSRRQELRSAFIFTTAVVFLLARAAVPRGRTQPAMDPSEGITTTHVLKLIDLSGGRRGEFAEKCCCAEPESKQKQNVWLASNFSNLYCQKTNGSI